jgi:5-methylcytosine-specific restriction endonuclease McrA
MTKKRITKRQRELVLDRAKGLCEYCRSPLRYSIQPFAVDHIVPVHQDGPNTLDNLAWPGSPMTPASRSAFRAGS